MVVSSQAWKLAVATMVILSCSGCAALDNGRTTIKASPLSSYSADPSSEVGSRNNPVALGDLVVISDWRVQLTSVNRDALQLVMKSDIYADRPSSNERYVLIEIKATYIGEESSEPNSDLRFKIVGSGGNTFSESCGYSTDTFEENGETFSGGTVTGNLCFTVDVDQITGATVSIQGGYGTQDRKFVSIDSN